MLAIAYYVQTVQDRFAAADKERGATAVEYGLMVGLIAVAIILTVTALGGELDRLFNEVSTRLAAVAP